MIPFCGWSAPLEDLGRGETGSQNQSGVAGRTATPLRLWGSARVRAVRGGGSARGRHGRRPRGRWSRAPRCGTTRPASGRGRSAGSARCRTAEMADPQRSPPAALDRRLGSVPLSSVAPPPDLDKFTGRLGSPGLPTYLTLPALLFLPLVPVAPPPVSVFADVSGFAGVSDLVALVAGLLESVSALAPALYDSLR